MDGSFKNKKILITGVCGTVGSDLIRLLLEDPLYQVEEVVGVDSNESELFFIEQRYIKDKRAKFFVGDIRDAHRINNLMKGIHIVFHAAALKHVVLCERSPYEAVQTNIKGVQNIITAAFENRVERVIFTSSDKAVNPTNVMGTSKLMGERLMTAGNSNQREKGPIFASTRFGNVMGSNGSVVPIFHRQIAKGGPVTVTDSDMTRFVMTIRQAVKLVVDSAMMAKGGEVFVTKMPVARISDLAQVMIEQLAPRYGYAADQIQIEVIGTKPGEKIYEELMSDEETRRAVELDCFFAVMPAFRGMYHEIDYQYDNVLSDKVDNPYISQREKSLSKAELTAFLLDNHLLDLPSEEPQPTQRYWPGDKA